MNPTKEEMLKQLGDILAQRNPGIKPKQARRSISKAMKHASYDAWIELYCNTMNEGRKQS